MENNERNSWLESGYLDDVDPSQHERVTAALNTTMYYLLGSRKLFEPILKSSVDMIKKMYLEVIQLIADGVVVIDVLADYLEFYQQHAPMRLDDSVIVAEFVKSYSKRYLN